MRAEKVFFCPHLLYSGDFMDINNEKNEYSKTAIIGVITGGKSETEVHISLDELTRLVDTAGGEVILRMTQNLHSPNPATLIGEGKLGELYWLCREHEIELAVFDAELSPSQIRNIEDALGNVRVIDRTILILDIFALHAKTGEGKLQVELAQLRYTAPRLTGHGREMSRLGGGIGTRGPGESKLESDRRHIQRRIRALEDELEALEKTRMTMRASRDRSGIPKVAIVGYTNAGKSTLLNRLTDAGILAEDKLFATLDPTTRKFTLPGGSQILLTDTVGFIRNLPHQVVRAFKSTLDEAVYADILIIICDASDPEHLTQLEVTENTLSELGAGDKPTLTVFNKCDLGASGVLKYGSVNPENICYISAKTGQGIEQFTEKLENIILNGKTRETFIIPNSEAGVLNTLYKNAATVESVEYGYENITAVATVDAKTKGMLSKFLVGGMPDGDE
jgi:GTP-binding protein HflX